MILEEIAKLIRAQIRACFARFVFFANCLMSKGYVILRKTESALRSSNLCREASFAISSFCKFITRIGFICICLCIPKFFLNSPFAFNLSRCQIELTNDDQWKIDSPEQIDEIATILSQPFYFLDKGKQSYVFVSENGRYVLKLFHVNRGKFHLGRQFYWKVKEWLGAKVIKESYDWEKSLKKTFDSCKIAYEKIRDLTEVEYIHLHLGQNFFSKTYLQLHGKWGKYLLDSSKYRFIIQKKAKPLLKTIQSASIYQKEKLFNSSLLLFQELGKRGIVNFDPNFSKNFSFYDDKMILSDIGSLSFSPETSQFIAQKHAKRFEKYFSLKKDSAFRR